MVKTGYNAVSRLASLLGFCCKDVTNMTDNSAPIEVTVLPVPVESMLYYYGSISRETAEWILWDRGCKDGMYLLRESNSDYVLSLCYQKSVLHYRIKKLSSGEVGLCGVPRQKFAGPVELVQGVEGLACKPTVPCNKSLDSVLPLTHWGVTEEAVRKAILKKAKEWGIDEDKLDTSLTENYNDIKLLITKTLHEIQPWYHGPLSRIEAERHIEESGHKDGKFLVRERDDSSYALCLSHSGRIKHYKIDVLPSGEFAIQDGQRFPSIMALVSHYTLFSDGLWCSLQDPCVVPPRRSVENSSQSRGRSSESSQQTDSRGTNSHQTNSSGGTLERNKNRQSQVTANSDGGSPPSKTNRFLSNLNQRKLFSKFFSSVAPQFSSQTLPQHSSRHHPSSSHGRTCLYPSLSDDNLDSGDLTRSVHARISPEFNNHPSTPPTCSRKSSLSSVMNDVSYKEGKKSNIQKASSFDFLPAFLSLFLYGDGSVGPDKKQRKSVSEIGHRKSKTDKDRIIDSHGSCNGETVHSATRADSNKKVHKSAPIPAPRLSLAKKDSQMSGPVYANREALATTGRSISLGENASCPLSGEVNNPLKTVQNGLPIPQPFIRSASSPSVVSHSKLRPQLPSRLSTSEGGSCEPIITRVIDESCRAASLNGPLHLQSLQVQPVPKPRKKLPFQEGQTETSCESCASVDSSTSPTLTEISEFGQESLSEDIFPSDIMMDEKEDVKTGSQQTNDLNCTLDAEEVSAVIPEPSNPVMSSGSAALEEETVSEVPPLPSDSVYATLSGSSDILCLLSNDVPSPPSSMPSVNCPEGILIDLDISDKNTLSEEESELAYLTLRQCRRGPLNLDQKAIDLKEKIGSGVFCDVFRGVFSSGPVEVQFAIKMLKSNSVPNPKSEILKEAQTMIALDHPHIVRLIGVSESNSFMLVTELAPLGPLNKYLRCHREISICEILLLMLQVASAMEYLESKQFVHRDLAARNVLLVNESFVKISDFGMSRALGLGKEYYRAETAGKWPLKWYAPECIYYFKFSTKSDVWSFGVTLWECASYGEKPYQGMIGRDILKMFEHNERLAKPDSCPESVYNLMWKCWQYKAEDRPSFSEVYEMLRDCIGGSL